MRTRTTLVFTLLTLVVAACGNGDGKAVESTTTPTVASATAESTSPPSSTATTSHDEHTEEPTHDDSQSHEDAESDHSEESVGDTMNFEVTMTEFGFEPAHIDVAAGDTIRFVIANEGAIEHEFRLSNGHRIEEHLASGHEDHAQEGGHHDEGGDIFLLLQPGETGELVVTFPEDTALYTEIACLIPGHYEAGMIGGLNYPSA